MTTPTLFGGFVVAAVLLGCPGAGDREGDATPAGGEGPRVEAEFIAAGNDESRERSPATTARMEIIWQSDDLEQPGAMAALDDERILVADRYRVHVITPGGGLLRTIGARSGEGPGEFASIYGVGVTGDTVLVYDVRTIRLSLLDSTGAFLGSQTLRPHEGFVNPETRIRLHVHDGHLILPATENVRTDGIPVRGAFLRYRLGDGAVNTVRAIDGAAWMLLGGDVIGNRQMFGPQAIMAVGPGGRIAFGEGLEYCVTIEDPVSDVQRVCHSRPRIPVTDAVRDPPLEALAQRVELPESRRQMMRAAVRAQEIGSHRPSYLALMFDDASRLWVQVVDQEQAQIHPWMLRYPELRPPHYVWDVFAPDGKHLGEVRLPSGLSPRLITQDAVYGVHELPSGEQVVARVRMPLPWADGSAR